jgi:hypothetical protein
MCGLLLGSNSLPYRQHSRVVSKVKDVAPYLNWVHDFIHREALDSKGMPPQFKIILDNAVKLVNFIKTLLLSNRLFSILCDEMGSECTQLLLFLKFTGFAGEKAFVNPGSVQQIIPYF